MSYSHFFSKNFTLYAIFNDQSFNDKLTNNIVSFEQLGPGFCGEIRKNIYQNTLQIMDYEWIKILNYVHYYVYVGLVISGETWNSGMYGSRN